MIPVIPDGGAPEIATWPNLARRIQRAVEIPYYSRDLVGSLIKPGPVSGEIEDGVHRQSLSYNFDVIEALQPITWDRTLYWNEVLRHATKPDLE
jgi:hypothetical protein